MRIYDVSSVTVVRVDKQLLIQAIGRTTSTGWTNPRLVVDDPNPADRVLEFGFEADRPAAGTITLPVLTPVTATFAADGKDVEAIIVRSRTNSITVHASEFRDLNAPVPTPQPITTFRLGEELPSTLALGEEGPFTTIGIVPGEEGPTFVAPRFEGPLGTDIRLDDPAARTEVTLAIGETPGGIDPRTLGQGTPFGGF